MATQFPLPADLPENWTDGQIVSPGGVEVGLSAKHGYNYLMEQVNTAQEAINELPHGKLESISVLFSPDKTVYRPGELFDPSGMIITAHYSNGYDYPIGGYSVTPYRMTQNTTRVNILYTENGILCETTQNVTVFDASIVVTSPAGLTLTLTGNGETQTKVSTGNDTFPVTAAGTYTLSTSRSDITGESLTVSKTVTISASGQTVTADIGFVYGYKKQKAESDPYARITYLFDAVGKTPASMDFTTGTFRYGGWADAWFVTGNKPLMLKSNGTVDYYLDPSDYTKKADGTSSDVADTSYDGNAMAQFPLAYFWRYEDSSYEYEIVAMDAWSSDFKAYAHTDASGALKPYFYWSLFGGSGSSDKIRSLKGQPLASALTLSQEITGAVLNGAAPDTGWYTHTWCQHEYIRTLLVLLGKSTNTQAVFGNGNTNSVDGTSSDMLQTGTLSDKGQFFGYSDRDKQVKVFHVEKFWGDQSDRIAGLLSNSGALMYKMTPEGGGYRWNNVTGYSSTGVTLRSTNGGYINSTKCGEWGCVPDGIGGSGATFDCDVLVVSSSTLSNFVYPNVGGCVADFYESPGASFLDAASQPSETGWYLGCGLSFV